MKKFRLPKKALIILALIGIGLFVWFFWPSVKIWWEEEKIEIKEREPLSSEIRLPVSSVYRYDFKEKEYLSDEGESWQNLDFSRYIYDLAPDGLKLEKCYYFTYDNIRKEVIGGGQRKCKANLTITVGQNQNCSSQGENVCTLYVYAIDNSGHQGEMAAVTYHIDWQSPEVGKVFQKEETETYFAEVSDNTKVNYCWFYINGQGVGSMQIEEGLASIKYSTESESYTAFVRCADYYEPEKENYLNLSSGEVLKIEVQINHPPQISSCRVVPTQGTRETDFNFKVVVLDPDGDKLSYLWNFGDGDSSTEENPDHRYQDPGTYEPKITVFDKKGKKDICSTAWAVVSED